MGLKKWQMEEKWKCIFFFQKKKKEKERESGMQVGLESIKKNGVHIYDMYLSCREAYIPKKWYTQETHILRKIHNPDNCIPTHLTTCTVCELSVSFEISNPMIPQPWARLVQR